MGTTVSWGQDVIQTNVNLDDAQDQNDLVGNQGEADAQYLRLKIIVGFTLPV